MSPSRTLATALLVLAVLPATPALADQAVAELSRQSPIAAYKGWEAWSSYDADTSRYRLMVRSPGGVAQPQLEPARQPFDISLGPDADGHVVGVYRQCRSSGCDIGVLSVSTGTVRTLRAVSSPTVDEATPAIFRSTVVFTRRFSGCDVPFVKDLGSSVAPRRLLGRKCLQTPAGHVSISGTRIVISSLDMSKADRNGAGPKTSELRRYSSRSRGSRVIASQTFGEESNLFGQVAQDNRYAYTVRTGIHAPNAFVRIPWSGGRPQQTRAFRTLTDAFAKPGANSSIYVASQESGGPACDGSDDVPCRLIYMPRLPFAGAQLRPPPRLSVAYQGQPRAGQPLTFTGSLSNEIYTTRSVVGTRLRTVRPVVGVDVELYRRVGSQPERFEPTGLHATTDADGSYTIVVPALDGNPWYTAVAATPEVPTWAGRGTVGSVAP
jgi:hypothetical protein